MKKVLLASAVCCLTVLSFGAAEAEAGSPFAISFVGRHGLAIGFGHGGHGFHRGHRGGRRGHVWHDTSRVDYVPGHYRRHYDYIPPHSRLHRTGHWDSFGHGHGGYYHW